MIQKIKILLILLIVAVGNNSCVKLEENTFGLVAPETLYRTETDFDKAVGGMYYYLCGSRSCLDSDYLIFLACGSDDVAGVPTASTVNPFNILKPEASNVFIRITWQNFYGSISSANAIIKYIGQAEGIPVEKLNEYEGHARFLRALSYFYLTRIWGEIPIIDETNSHLADVTGQSPVSDIYDFIISDLKLAEGLLAVSYPEKGKATKGAAKTLLAEVYLTRAGWPLNDASYYALARDKAKEVMDLGIYELEADFANLWKLENKLSLKEAIFTLYPHTGNGGWRMQRACRPAVENGYANHFSQEDFFNNFPEGPRKESTFHTVFTDGSTWQDDQFKAPYIAKYRDGGSACGPDQGKCAMQGEGFNAVLRYAEVLLIYAEAANMAESGPSAAALEALNQVRRRAGGYNQVVYADLPSGMSQADFDKAVLDERAWEFAGEINIKRWFDLVRKNMVVEINKDKYPYVDEHNNWLPKYDLDVELVEGLEQNPGY